MNYLTRILLPVMVLSACSTAPKDRTLVFDGIENARELGGLVMQDGRVVREGVLVRSGELSKASDADVALLKERFALTDVFDFRFELERSRKPDREMEGVTNTWLSTLPQAFLAAFASGRADSTTVQSASLLEALASYAFHPQAQEMAQKLYPAIVTDTTSQKRYGEFLRGVLEAKGGVLWHCSQGKDRCGWGSAFVLAALGAGRETIVEDFALSNVSYEKAVEALSAQVVQKGGGEPELAFIRAMVGVSVENFERTLEMIDAQYGSLPAYLEKALGFTAEEQQKMKEKYLK
ncbi:MAG: tyrosine-protein phosphatase [Candidatus Cryptobacteroides sp.]|nr:tyrosine-protein phosphatase [Candidatus Cryptobacteroides sp.]